MDTILDFQPDEAMRQEARPELSEESQAMLTHRYLQVPLSLKVGGVWILDAEPMPILKMAFDAWFHLRRLPNLGHSYMILPDGGGIDFALDGANVVVTGKLSTDVAGSCPYEELLEVWSRFSDNARRFLIEVYPWLTDHSQLGPWVRDGTLPSGW